MTAPVLPASAETIARAADVLAAGGLVALPTETVYGLAAAADDAQAVARIYEAKDRPRFNPLIIHTPDRAAAEALAALPPIGSRLADAFWPGALTLVAPARPGGSVSDLARAGLTTLAVRAPAHPVAQAILRAAGRPLAAPSANRSGRLSPTRAVDVARDLGDRVDLIIDGGPCRHGVESTIVDVSGAAPAILRAGAIARSELEAIAGPLAGSGEEGRPRAPGQLTTHYAPARARLRLNAASPAPGEAYLGFGATPWCTLNLSASGDVREAAASLFAKLRALDEAGYRAVAVAPVPDEGLGEAIADRLRRAAAGRG